MTQHAKTRKPAKRATPDAVAFLDGLFGGEADWESLVGEARVNRDVAHALYDLRTARGLTQRQLAELVGTKQPVIARLEDADYEGHSLSMLSRIAAALHHRVSVEFVPLTAAVRRRQAPARSADRPQRGVHVQEDHAGRRVAASTKRNAATAAKSRQVVASRSP
ncbi:MAG: helix-turn-helix transcriptional regulator [Gemmatimonadaceae bacterium]